MFASRPNADHSAIEAVRVMMGWVEWTCTYETVREAIGAIHPTAMFAFEQSQLAVMMTFSDFDFAALPNVS